MRNTLTRRRFLKTTALAGGAALLPACAGSGPGDAGIGAASNSQDAAGSFGDVANALLRTYPESATWLGLDKGDLAYLRGDLTDRTPAGVAARAADATQTLAEVRTRLPALEGTERLNGEVVEAAYALAVEGYAFGFGDTVNLDPYYGYRNGPYVVTQNMGAFIETPDFMANHHPVATPADIDAFFSRLSAYAGQLVGETQRLRADREAGVVAPDFILGKALKTLGGGLAQPAADNMIVKLLADGGGDPADIERARRMIDAQVKPALAQQIEELRRHAAVATSDAGVWHVPNGEAYYRWALKAGTTTELSPQEIHEIGQENLRIVQARMDTILKANGMSGGTVGERMAALGERPDQLFANTASGREELLTYVRGIIDDIRGRMPEAFETLVPGSLNVKRVPVEIEAGAPGGSAASGAVDGSTPGTFYINLVDTALQPKFGLPTLAYHEAIPGHVWQGEYTNAQPLARTLLSFNAYSEGWALYAEQLAAELGVYEDNPLGELGYLQANAFRCCRLVVDTGMHALRWSREQAIDWFVTNNGSPRGEVESEIDRYCAWPGQACGYKIGEIAINRNRDRARAELGDAYEMRTFNDAVVLGGNVPMTVLDRIIDRYIAGAG